jgi:hypothetical protein
MSAINKREAKKEPKLEIKTNKKENSIKIRFIKSKRRDTTLQMQEEERLEWLVAARKNEIINPQVIKRKISKLLSKNRERLATIIENNNFSHGKLENESEGSVNRIYNDDISFENLDSIQSISHILDNKPWSNLIAE